jgi:catechol 2,3-dioxygenase-like lactoylglutathione lyase family enzyme
MAASVNKYFRLSACAPTVPFMRLHHAGISVPDLDRSLTWYCEALGLRPGFRFEVPPIGLRGAFALGDGAVAVWDPRDSPEPGVRMAYVTDPDGNLIELVAPGLDRGAERQ